jgi:LPXTG-motif cell wall-anchored protein
MPDELPQTGPEDWLKWIVSGLALVGIGLLLL